MKKIVLISILLSMIVIDACDKYNTTRADASSREIHITFTSLSDENLFDKLNVYYFQNTNLLKLNKEEYELELYLDGTEVIPNNIGVGSSNNKLRLTFGCGYCDEILSEKRDYFYEYRFICPKIFGDDRVRIITAKCKHIRKHQYRNTEITFDGQIICQSDDCGLGGEGVLNVTVE